MLTNLNQYMSYMCVISRSTRFILLRTLQNENVGASARAIKNIGFHALSLVNPHDLGVLCRDKVVHRASGATDILKNAMVFTSLEEAVDGCDIICGTGMPIDMYRKRRERVYLEPRQYFETLNHPNDVVNDSITNDRSTNDRRLSIAFVFGSETTGMTEEEMDHCQVMLGIPTNPKFGSLNLASAVQLIAYDWRMALGGRHSYF
ncbi:hypothetical protein HJC23_001057 [Cyclotella cryptica]|uniref:tRNA/rRNA methyltransferase SpoU type domain-containing protein n=1 Tax=Cyclotella cryptica TaxID=29204 RepID=A0ABD3QKQ7_9STRA|eukprot:CCRYP_005003-RA/>CCRYP_005003-RA protein AED:0.18 eAED:0.18 QI:0/-1/0/1/-1/1/1/0/203